MNETVYVYIVHSDINENNIYTEFETEEEAIEYARRNKDELTYVDRVEVALDEDGDIIEEFDSETIWVYDEEADFEDSDENDFFSFQDEEVECQNCGSLVTSDRCIRTDGGDYVCKDCIEEDFDTLVETLEENEDIVECKECFELFPKEACTKVAIGYICPECGKIHSHEEPEFEIDSIPDVVAADDDFFKVDFPELERVDYGNDMIPDEPTPEVEPNPEPMPEIGPNLEPECVGPDCEAPVEAPVTKEETITKLVIDEHEAIDGYEKAKIEIEANPELDEKEKEEILDTIEHIKEEEVEHIEELEELVNEVEETKVDEPNEESEVEDESEVLVEDDTLVDTRKRTRRIYGDVDYNDVKHLDRIVARARRYKGEPRKLSAESLAWVFRESTLKHLLNGLADCNSLEDVEKKLDPYFDYLPNSIYNSGIEAYDEIVSVLPEALWELKTGIPVDKEGLDEKLIKNDSEVLVEGSGFLGKIILDDYFKKDGERNPENKNGTGYWVDLVDPDTKESIIKPEDKKTVQKLKDAEAIATQLSKAEDGWAVIRVEGAQGWNGILELYEDGKRTQDVTQKKLANLNKAWDEQEAKKKARQALDKSLGKTKKDSENIDLPGNTEQQPNEDQNTNNVNNDQENQDQNTNDQEAVNSSEVAATTVKPKNAAAVKANKEYKKIIDALKKIGIATSEISKLIQGKKPTGALKELRKLLFVESLEEHVNEEHPAIESDQELDGIDNAVVDCEVADVITHSEDEKLLDCEMEKAPLEKPLTEDLSEDKLQVMEDYLKSTKFASLDTEWEDEGDFYVDIIGAYLDYSARTNMFSLGLSIYHASEDNNAEYPERHTDEEEFNYDSLAEMYEDEECKEILDRLYEDNLVKLGKSLSEDTHAKYAKPEGNRVQAFNNALKYAKQYGKPFIYGYTNYTGKFFAAETPMKVTGSPAEAEKEFRQQYKNCKIVYVVYPDKEFVREGLFTKAEQEEYNMDEDGNSLDSYDTYIRCGFCDEIYTKSECKYERNLGWLCPRCEAAIYSRGEKLTFVDPDEFLEN